MAQELTLFQYDSCPYCARVRRFMADNGLEVPMKDTLKDPTARDALRSLGGKTQVPALQIGDSILYESNDIIEWMRKNLLDGRAN